jgi:hypothetical protein
MKTLASKFLRINPPIRNEDPHPVTSDAADQGASNTTDSQVRPAPHGSNQSVTPHADSGKPPEILSHRSAEV